MNPTNLRFRFYRRPALWAIALVGMTDFAGAQMPDIVGRPQRPQPRPPAHSHPTSSTLPKGHGGVSEFRTIDGSGNNPLNPELGIGDSPFLRIAPPAYGDGVDSPSGADRPNPRTISNVVCTQTTSVPNRAGYSAMFWGWGQFIDHDMIESPTMDPVEHLNIPVPTGDPSFDPAATGTKSIPFDRSYWEPINGIREQFNELSSYLDGTMIYGGSEERETALRTNDGTGRLKTSPGNYLPYNTEGLENQPTTGSAYFLAGDVRANEQVGLTSLHTIFVREHNFWARTIAEEHARVTTGTPTQLIRGIRFPGLARFIGAAPLDDERIFQLARAIVVAEIQAVTYREYLPVLLGRDGLPPYRGYNPHEDPSIRSEFAASAYRFGHSTLSSSLLRLGADGKTIAEGNLSLAQSFFSVSTFLQTGPDPIIRGLAVQRAEELDAQIVDEVRNFLFGPPGSGGLDLASLNIQRGRDWGHPDYNSVRRAVGLRPVRDFAGITRNTALQAKLTEAYTTVSLVDPWIGMLCEDHIPGATVGETLFSILGEQFQSVRDGDRFWYQSYLPQDLRETVERQRLSVIIRRNTDIGAELREDVFHVAPPPTSGTIEIRPTPRPTNTPEPRPTVTPRPTATPLPTVTPRPTQTPNGTPTPRPTQTPNGTPTPRPTVRPTVTPNTTPTPRPTVLPTVTPNTTPTPRPTDRPTTGTPTPRPTDRPTTGTPTPRPTDRPTTGTPTPRPTVLPTVTPNTTPTPRPTDNPTTGTPRPTPPPTPTPTGTPRPSPTPNGTPRPSPNPSPTPQQPLAYLDNAISPDRRLVS